MASVNRLQKLGSQKHLAIAMVMNTFSPMLGVRVSRLPSSVLRMLLGQEIIPGYEFPYMRLLYVLVMLVPVLHIITVLVTLRRIRSWGRSTPPAMPRQFARYFLLLLIWNADISTVILFQPDVGWVAVVSGVFAIVWGVISTSIGISLLRQTHKRLVMV